MFKRQLKISPWIMTSASKMRSRSREARPLRNCSETPNSSTSKASSRDAAEHNLARMPVRRANMTGTAFCNGTQGKQPFTEGHEGQSRNKFSEHRTIVKTRRAFSYVSQLFSRPQLRKRRAGVSVPKKDLSHSGISKTVLARANRK